MKLAFLLIFALLILPLVEASLQEAIELEKTNLESLIPARKVGLDLPLTFELKTDEGEDIFLRIDDDGKISFLTDAKPDLIVSSKEANLEKFLEINTEEDLIRNLDLINIEAVSFKGKVAVEVGENLLNVEIMKNKSFSQRFIGFFIKPVIKVTGFFIK